MSVIMNIQVFYDVMTCRLLNTYVMRDHLAFSLKSPSSVKRLDHEEEGKIFFETSVIFYQTSQC